jgi:molybdate transport system permease protein
MTIRGAQTGRVAEQPATRPVGRRPPAALAIPAIVGLTFLLLPLLGLLIRAPWSGMVSDLTDPAAVAAFRLSLETATISTVICLVLGVPIAYLLARVRFPGQQLARALVTLPLVLPPVVGGVALFTAYGRMGVVGRWWNDWFGLSLPFTTAAVIVAQTFVAMPFLIIAVEGSLRGADARYEEAAATLGASRWTAFRRVTLPLVMPGVAAGSVLCWARALGEFGATITFAGNFPGTTQTMPLLVYQALETTNPGSATALSLLLVAVCVVVLVALRGRWIGMAA